MSETTRPDEFAVVANVILVHKFFRTGAKVVIVNLNPGNAGEYMEVSGLTRSGRRAQAWVGLKYLDNFRAKWHRGVPPLHYAFTREEAERFAKARQRQADTERQRVSDRTMPKTRPGDVCGQPHNCTCGWCGP